MIVVRFLNKVSGSGSVRQRTFTDEGAYLQWADSVRTLIEIVSVERVQDEPEQPRVVDLMEALEASLAAVRAGRDEKP